MSAVQHADDETGELPAAVIQNMNKYIEALDTSDAPPRSRPDAGSATENKSVEVVGTHSPDFSKATSGSAAGDSPVTAVDITSDHEAFVSCGPMREAGAIQPPSSSKKNGKKKRGGKGRAEKTRSNKKVQKQCARRSNTMLEMTHIPNNTIGSRIGGVSGHSP